MCTPYQYKQIKQWVKQKENYNRDEMVWEETESEEAINCAKSEGLRVDNVQNCDQIFIIEKH